MPPARGYKGTPIERFRKKVEFDPATGCVVWVGAHMGSGYGNFACDGTWHSAHRWIYELLVGTIPEGLELDHLCRNRACVNIAHLEPVTTGVNILRGVGPSATNARKVVCDNGHPLVGPKADVYRYRNRRLCRPCRREANRRWVVKAAA